MGIVTSKVVNPAPSDMPSPPPPKKFRRGRNRIQRRSNRHYNILKQASRAVATSLSDPSSPLLDYQMKKAKEWVPPSISQPHVWVVTPDSEGDRDEDIFPADYIGRRRDDGGDGISTLEKLSQDFAEFEGMLMLDNMFDEASRLKLRRFVVAWRYGLSFAHSKMEKAQTGIPVAATTYCQQTISRWTRFHRHCLRCVEHEDMEHLEDDLTHRHSLERFYEKIEEMATISGTSITSICQRQKRMNMYECIYPTKKTEPEPDLFDDEVKNLVKALHHHQHHHQVYRHTSTHQLVVAAPPPPPPPATTHGKRVQILEQPSESSPRLQITLPPPMSEDDLSTFSLSESSISDFGVPKKNDVQRVYDGSR